MIWTPFKGFSKTFLGIDIGTSSVKIVEVSRWGKKKRLVNYGEIPAANIYESSFRTFEKNTLLLSEKDIARGIQAVIEEAKIKTKKVVLSIPDFSTFYTSFELPPVSEEELPRAIEFEARRYIPLPVSEVSLDWQITEGSLSGKKNKVKILLVAVPNDVVRQYKNIAALCGLDLFALEAEVFGLVRSLAAEEKNTVCLVDIGSRSTTISIVDRGILKLSHSFDISGSDFTQQIAKSLGVDHPKAEALKQEHGLLPGSTEKIDKILYPLIDLILVEVEKIFNFTFRTEEKKIEKIILAGGAAKLPGLKSYFSVRLNSNLEKDEARKKVVIGNPFASLYYPPILEQSLEDMGPSYAIAVGMALRGLN